MDWSVFFIALAVLVLVFDFDLIIGMVFACIITWIYIAVDVTHTTTDEISAELNKIQMQIQMKLDKQKADNVEFPPAKPEPTKVISTRNYDDVKRVYISNSKRTSDVVQMKTLAGKTYACKKDETCITEPTMKRHIDNVLYACDSDVCYPVQ